MAESTPYLLPSTQGRYVTVTVTNNNGEVYRINDDATRTIYADYFLENNKTIIEASTFSSEEFQRNLAQNSQGYNRTISNSILEANKQTNSQPNPNDQNTQGGESSSPTTAPSTTPATPKSALVYPLDMAKTKQDRIKFSAVEYQPSGNLSAGTLSPQNRTSTTGKNIKGFVFLPIQASITDQNSADWQGANLNEIERTLVNLSLGAMKKQDVKDLTGLFGQFGNKALQEVVKAGDEVRVALAGEAVGIQNLIGRFGTVLNPNLELLFTGPQLRPFEFQFKMSAREQNEANNIKEIIKFFKKNMAPIGKSGEVFLRAPYTFFIEYMYGGETQPHPGINKIKECALLNCAVDYTPNGTYMTYQDGTMVSYTLSLSFQELEPIYSGDYDGHSIGY